MEFINSLVARSLVLGPVGFWGFGGLIRNPRMRDRSLRNWCAWCALQSNDEDTTSHGSAGVGVAATEGDDMAVVAADEQEQMGSAETEDHIQRILAAIDNYTRQVSGHLILISCIIAGAHAMRACVCRCRRCWMPAARCSRTSPPTSRSASAREDLCLSLSLSLSHTHTQAAADSLADRVPELMLNNY